MSRSVPQVSPSAIKALVEFSRRLDAPGFSPGRWVAPRRTSKVLQIGFFSFSEQVDDFIEMLYREGLIIDFDWPAWAPRAKFYMDHPEAVARAQLPTLVKLLTTHVRADRFSEGHLHTVFESGHIRAILRRAEALAAARKII